MPAVPTLRVSRPHSNAKGLLWTGSENVGLVAAAGWPVSHRRTAIRAGYGKAAQTDFPYPAADTAVDAIPLGRAHGTLQPEWMKVS